ncbi:hypothetical protein QOZ80_1AG0048420 [Eleusine coracana subsp. coracana]|nr:hypothetical protein QOZ80_1AG0048420 [Eleusine coracana subsp. coracana]
MADARARASNSKGSASTRLRVMRPEVQEVLRSPRRKKQQPPPPSPPQASTFPPQQQEEEEKEEEFEPARYKCAFQDETRDFAPPDLVWGKVRSHPWWPGQVFDPADASEVALQHRRAGAPLVAYFWDKTFAWNDASALLPFHANFTRFSAQSTMFGFVSAVDAALQEVGRRVEAGLSCACFGSTMTTTKQEVHNSGVRQGAYGAVVDSAYMRDAFGTKALLHYISSLAKRPLAGADLLDLATAQAHLRVFNRSRGPRGLPEFLLFQGIDEDVEDAILHTKRKRMHKSNENDDVLSKDKKSRHNRTNEALSDFANEKVPSRGATHEDTVSKGNKSKGTKSSTRKKTKHSDGLETAAAAAAGGGSSTPANKAVDNVLSESKSVRTLRSMSKKEDALEGLKRLGKGGGETSSGNSKDAPLMKENKLRRIASAAHKKDKITEDGKNKLGDSSSKDSASPAKTRSGCTENSVSKRVLISEHGRKKKKLSELMAETGKPNSTPYRKHKTRVTPSALKAEDPDRDSKDTAATRKRKKLNTLGDLSSQSQPLSRKKSTKAGELMSKASGHTTCTLSPVKTNGAGSQTKLHGAKHKHGRTRDESPHSVKVNRHKKDVITEESLSCGEMLWQLALAACDLKQRERIAPTSVNFFTGFRKNSNVSSCDVDKELPEMAAETESTPSEQPAKAAETESTPSGQPIADHMQDDYWADILINVEEPLASLKKKDESKKRTSKKAHQLKKLLNDSSVTVETVGKSTSENKQDTEDGEQPKDESKPFVVNGSRLNAGTKSAEEIENSLLAGLVLHFSRPSAVPSRSDLIKIFSQYGPVKEAKAEIPNNANSAQVIFKRRMDAEAAFAGAGKISALGPALDSFRLTDFPAAGLGDEPSHGASKGDNSKGDE